MSTPLALEIVSSRPTRYNFTTHAGQASSVRIDVKSNLSDYTLVCEVDTNSNFPSPTVAGTVSYANRGIILSFTAAEVDGMGDCVYRIYGTNNSNRAIVFVEGRIDFKESKVVVPRTPDPWEDVDAPSLKLIFENGLI